MSTKKIGIIVGSLRKESFSRKVGEIITKLAPESFEFDFLEIGNLALYNQDLDNNPPENWKIFREKIKSCDGILFFSPEYNRSVPGVLKNAIDIGSRPYGQSVWDKKPAGVISVSPGAIGGFGANHHLRQSLVFLNMPAMQQPEAYIGNVSKLFDKNNELIDSSTREFLKKFIQSFADWVDQHSVISYAQHPISAHQELELH